MAELPAARARTGDNQARVNSETGNPAVIGPRPLDRKLCVPTFRWVCLYQ
jgi:hypothetical protein